MALLAPAAEFVAPLLLLVAELLFWIVLIVIELFVAMFCMRKAKIPEKPTFTGARNGLKPFAIKTREKRTAKKNNS